MEAPFFPLRLVEEHLDALEGLLARTEGMRLDRRDISASLAKLTSQRELRLRALALRRDEAVHEASVRLHGRSPGAARAAAFALLRLAPEHVIAVGRLRASERASRSCLPVLCDLPRELLAACDEDDPALLVARASQGLASPEAIRRAVRSERPWPRWAGLVAAASQREPCGLEPALEVLASTVWDPPARRAAIFALGRLVSRHPNDAGPAGLCEALLGERLLEVPGAIVVAALFGHIATGLRLRLAISQSGARAEWIQALGVLGLSEMLAGAESWVPTDAELEKSLTHARHAVAGGDGVSSPERCHLGKPLRSLAIEEASPPSARWLAELHGPGPCRPPLQLLLHGTGEPSWSLLS